MSVAAWGPPSDPTIYGMLDVDVTRLLPLLEQRSRETGVRLTLTHAVARALALAIREHPSVNVLVRWRRIYQRENIDIFLQVAVVEAGSDPDLSGVKIERADEKSLVEMAAEIAERASAVREGRDKDMRRSKKSVASIPSILMRPVLLLMGWIAYTMNIDGRLLGLPRDPFGSAMVTSVGMFGIRVGFAPLFPPSRSPVLVLVGALEDRPVVRDGRVEIRPMVTLTGTFDHRVIDGYHGGLLARTIKSLLEDPPESF
jgi:pyruvate dehydrogenase E2 component (dihydrolipoamide acetyltransferase)